MSQVIAPPRVTAPSPPRTDTGYMTRYVYPSVHEAIAPHNLVAMRQRWQRLDAHLYPRHTLRAMSTVSASPIEPPAFLPSLFSPLRVVELEPDVYAQQNLAALRAMFSQPSVNYVLLVDERNRVFTVYHIKTRQYAM